MFLMCYQLLPIACLVSCSIEPHKLYTVDLVKVLKSNITLAALFFFGMMNDGD